jgi:hypothetical protein
MASRLTDVLTPEDLTYLNNHPAVLKARESLDAKESGSVYFSIPTTESLRTTLQANFGLNLETVAQIPMRWIKGDTAPHVDVGPSSFENTYLLYLNDSTGALVVESESFPIQRNTGFVFNEGLSHETRFTENVPRLLLGPMNEFAQPVGGSVFIFYYASEADALSGMNPLGYSYTYTVGSNGPFGPYTSWRIASNSTGTSPQNVVYVNGSELDPNNNYNLYPAVPCFLEGSTILCKVDGVVQYVPVEELKKGTLVKTSLDGFKEVVLLGKGTLQNLGNDERKEDRLYKCSKAKYPELREDLFLTGCHSLLEYPITEQQKDAIINCQGKLYVTDKKYRLMAWLDERAEPWNSEGAYTVWHFALENKDDGMNYGVYANGGLLVETCSIRFLKNKSNMELFC